MYYLLDVCVFIFLTALTILALSNGGYRVQQNRTFAYVSTSVSVWLVTNQISNDLTTPPSSAVLANFLLFPASILSAVFAIRFIAQISSDSKAKRVLRFSEIPALFVALISATPLVGGSVEARGDTYAVIFGPLASLYGGTLVLLVLAIFYMVARNWNHPKRAIRQQVRTAGAGLWISAPLLLIIGFVIPYYTSNFAITQISMMPMVIFLVSLYVSVSKHGLFDVKHAAVRTTGYVFSIATLSLVYFGLAYVVSVLLLHNRIINELSISPINILLALLLAFIFQPIKHFFDHWTNRIFYRDQYDTAVFVEQLGWIVTSTTRLREVMERSLDKITHTLKSDGGLFIVYRDHHDDAIVGRKSLSNFTDEEYELLRRLVELHGSKIMHVDADNRRDKGDMARLRRVLVKHHVALVLPLTSVNETIGYVLLGEQMSNGYSKRDIATLEMISNELVIAIMNARSMQVVRDLNTHLEQRVNEATHELQRSNARLIELDTTKDEFISMASHQLRTPLTSIKGYISMVLEGDAGTLTEAQQKLLSEAFTSSERMVHLISDFLNVSRLQTGKFMIERAQVNLCEVIADEVAGMRQMATSHGVEIVYRKPRVCPLLYVDEGKLRQVVMNFIDNAIYYSPESKKITVRLSVEDGDIVFRVIDRGMGVPIDVQKKLFTKFFRAENARKQRPDGTGVGLFLAKKVINGHNGKIVFESTLGKGSTFGFRLPIKRLSNPPRITDDSQTKTA